MDQAVPANLQCGRPAGAAMLPAEPTWAQLTCSFGGIWEIQPAALEEHLAGPHATAIQIIDVREAAEFSDALGHIPGATLLPLSELTQRMAEIDAQRPVVAVCRSGVRSAQAVVLLQKSGFSEVANLAGGMLRWRAESCRVARGEAS
jgi:rhodanese-related sulfurtransferase